MNGLVLAGGKSSRMHQNKAMLHYKGKPQYQVCVDLLKPLCGDVFVSCKKEDAELYSGLVLEDAQPFAHIGPMGGLLSAFEKTRSAWFVLGCDYPLLSEEDIANLYNHRNPEAIATAYYLDAMHLFEPLIGIYEVSAMDLLLSDFIENKHSLQHFLQQNNATRIAPKNPMRIESANTPESYQKMLRLLSESNYS